jgi:hypothetical protein
VWLFLMALGLIVALLGIAMRTFARRFDSSIGADSGRLEGELAGAEAEGAGGRPDDEAPARVPAGPPAPPAGDFVPDEDVWGDRSVEAGVEAGSEGAFTWDSSALLTEPHDEEPSEAFAAEPVDRTAVWARPVPLPMEDEAAAADDTADDAVEGDAESHPEVVRDEEGHQWAGLAADSAEAQEAAEETISDGSAGDRPRGGGSARKESEEQRKG